LEQFIPDPSVTMISRCIEGRAEGLRSTEEECRAISNIVPVGQEMERREGVGALLLSCAADPGVSELRETEAVPGIGVGSASASVALSFGKPVGALTLNPRFVVLDEPTSALDGSV